MDIRYAMLSKESEKAFLPYLFGDATDNYKNKNTYIMGAIEEDVLVGAACFNVSDTPILHSVAVSKRYERQGIGSTLLDHVAGLLIDEKMDSLEAVLSGSEDDVDGLEYFLYRCGFDTEESRPDVYVTIKEVLELKAFKAIREGKESSHVHVLSEMSKTKWNNLGNLLANKTGYRSFPAEGLIPEYSTCYEQDGRITACVLIGREDDDLLLQYAFVYRDTKDKMALLAMMNLSLSRMEGKEDKEKRIRVSAANDISEQLISYFFEDKAKENRVYRYVLHLSKDGETGNVPVTDTGDLTEDAAGGALSKNPGFIATTNADYICRDCIYRIEGGAPLVCHKYSEKPDEVLTRDVCPCYRKEMEV